jgi:hypothetical protein
LIGLNAEPIELGWGVGASALVLLFMARPRP